MDDKSNTTRYFVNAYYVYSIDNNGILHVRNDDWFLHSEKWRRVERYERDRYHRPYENCLLNTPRTELSEKDVDIITPYLFCDFPSEGYRQKQKVMKIERAAFYFHFYNMFLTTYLAQALVAVLFITAGVGILLSTILLLATAATILIPELALLHIGFTMSIVFAIIVAFCILWNISVSTKLT